MIRNVRLHRDFRETECPGTYFPRSFVVSLRQGSRARTGARACDCATEARAAHGRGAHGSSALADHAE